MASRFGEMLLNRRRDLGLSIQQVANVIKIRPQIIEFFETGNFASMPPRGYAQGMIASYARYLGLNPREVVNAYFDELYVFERGGSAAGSQFTEGATNPVPRSASMSGRYLMVDTPGSSSRYAQRPPQAGYVSDSTSGHVPLRVADNQRRAANLPPAGATGRVGYGAARTRRLYDDGADQGAPIDETVQMRRPAGYQGPSNIARSAAMSRPRGSRPGQLGQRPGSRGGSRASGGRGGSGRPPRRGSGPQRGGLLDDPRVMIGGLVAILVLLALVIFLLVRSCTATPAENDPNTAETPAATTAATPDTADDPDAATDGDDTADEDPDADADADADADDDADTAQAADSPATPAEPVETEVGVSIEEGVTSWLEVYVDGVSVYAAQTAGPFEQTWIPSASIEITVDHPGDVKVTENGESVDWDTRTSGVGKVTIAVPQPATPEADEGDGAADGESTDAETDTYDDSAAAAE